MKFLSIDVLHAKHTECGDEKNLIQSEKNQRLIVLLPLFLVWIKTTASEKKEKESHE